MPLPAPESSLVPLRRDGAVRRFAPGAMARRIITWIRGWHGGQLLTFWAGATIVPWQIGVWRETLIRNRLEGFLNPGVGSLGWAGRVADILGYVVLPSLALLATAIWVSGRVRRKS